MDAVRALAVVRSLANGVNPESGEVFPPDSVYQRPQVVRALYSAASALEQVERVERRRAQLPQKTSEPWSENEDRKLTAAFDAGRALQELAAAHERTTSAVRARLVKYDRLASKAPAERRVPSQKRGDSPSCSPYLFRLNADPFNRDLFVNMSRALALLLLPLRIPFSDFLAYLAS